MKCDADRAIVSLNLVVLSHEALDFANVLKDFFSDNGGAGDFVLNPGAHPSYGRSQNEAHTNNDRHQDDDKQGQPPIKPEHDAYRTKQCQGLLQERTNIAGQDRAYDRDVGRNPAYQFADAAIGIKLDGQELQMGVKLLSDIDDNPFAHIIQVVVLHKGRDRTDQEHH